ncbi:DUF177 domain-containing protein [Pseudoruegeria sp. HB172150]|uniref:YceD family protein n=1 Tax=Pseudoruegeria sp. HB172150 TaxID=2721164 RepID=UPI001554DE7F|nr:DUF177 domain-containing protein [Pseudoruegeria sp. HB172150]
MEDTPQPEAGTPRLRLQGLHGDGVRDVLLQPDATARAAIAEELDLLGLRKLRLKGRLIPEGKSDWRLEAQIGATVVQPCVSTLEPVTTRIDADITRRYLADPPPMPEGDEVEIPEDDTIEELPAVLDLEALMIEELALNLPLYPHVDGAAPVEETFAAPGAEPISEEETKPFAGLASLKDKMGKDG